MKKLIDGGQDSCQQTHEKHVATTKRHRIEALRLDPEAILKHCEACPVAYVRFLLRLYVYVVIASQSDANMKFISVRSQK
jgi:hypothetical protein